MVQLDRRSPARDITFRYSLGMLSLLDKPSGLGHKQFLFDEIQFLEPDLGRGPYETGDIAAKLGTDSPRVAPLRNQLIAKDLVYSTSHGITDFTVPQFDDFLRRSYPLPRTKRSPRGAQRQR